MKKFCQLCDKSFTSKTKGQIYCSPECRTQAQRQKIDERSKRLKEEKRRSKERKCAGGCGTTLSFYNENTFCDRCQVDDKKYRSLLREILKNGKDNG